MAHPQGSEPDRTGAVFGTVWRHRGLIALPGRVLAQIAAIGLVAGLLQAFILILVAQIALVIGSERGAITLDLPFVDLSSWTVGQLVLLGLGALVVLATAETLNSWLQTRMSTNAVASAQSTMFEAFARSDFGRQTELSRGEANKVVFGFASTASSIANAFASSVTSLCNFVVLVGVALVMNPVAALAAAAVVLIIVVLLRPMWARVSVLSDLRATAERAFGGVRAERFEMTAEIKAFGVGDRVDSAIRDHIEELRVLNRRVAFVSKMSSVVFRVGGLGFVLGVLGVLTIMDSVDVASLAASLLLLLRSLSYGQAVQRGYQQTVEQAPRLLQLAAEHEAFERAQERNPNFPRSWNPAGDVEARGLHFEYEPGQLVLRNVDVAIGAGDFVAIIGPSGAGKSTLLQLLLRLRRPTSGSITIDGVDFTDIALDDWRASIGYVPQLSRLRGGTVRDAIRFGRPHLTEAQLRDAAARAQVLDDIESWSDGWDTELRHVGESLSGGQRQRIALARALASDPSILFLDEPTSSLDPDSERLVAEALLGLKGSVTIVVVAHRLATIEHADSVIEVDANGVRSTSVDAVDATRFVRTID